MIVRKVAQLRGWAGVGVFWGGKMVIFVEDIQDGGFVATGRTEVRPAMTAEKTSARARKGGINMRRSQKKGPSGRTT